MIVQERFSQTTRSTSPHIRTVSFGPCNKSDAHAKHFDLPADAQGVRSVEEYRLPSPSRSLGDVSAQAYHYQRAVDISSPQTWCDSHICELESKFRDKQVSKC